MLSRRIKDKLSEFETPLYLYDMELLRRTLDCVKTESGKYGYKVHYAIKANFDSRILDAVKDVGFGVDCVSGNEVKCAVEAGFDPKGIAFAGVGKSDKEIRYSLSHGIFAFNCESRHELEVINEIATDMGVVADVALRINPDVDPMTHKHISTGNADSKFGISYKEVEEVASELDGLKSINITGLHFHIGSQICEMRVFEYLCLRANTLMEWFAQRGFKFTHLNLGGGLGINYKDPESEPIPDFGKYFEVFHNNLKIDPSIEVHFELGRSIVGQCGELISRVLYNKTNAVGKHIAIVDASMTELIRPALYQASHAMENLSGGREKYVYTIGGTVCESSDIFARDIELPQLNRGDIVTFKSTGAYGAAMASRYNLHDIPEAVYSDELMFEGL